MRKSPKFAVSDEAKAKTRLPKVTMNMKTGEILKVRPDRPLTPAPPGLVHARFG